MDGPSQRRCSRWSGIALAVAATTSCTLPGAGVDPDRSSSVSTLVQSTEIGPLTARWSGPVGATRALLIHGTPGDGSGWGELLLDPPPGLELVAVDRPGFGGSAVTGVRPTLEAQAMALEPFLAVRDGRATVVVGHSYGGPVALDLAARFPDRVAAVVVVAGSVDPQLEEWRWFNVAADLFAWLLPVAIRNSNDEVRALAGELEDLARRLPAVRAPVVLLHGVRDALVPYANVDFMVEALSGAPAVEVRRVEDAGHFVPWTHPGELRAAIASARALGRAAAD